MPFVAILTDHDEIQYRYLAEPLPTRLARSPKASDPSTELVLHELRDEKGERWGFCFVQAGLSIPPWLARRLVHELRLKSGLATDGRRVL